jgi:hypothetical protein
MLARSCTYHLLPRTIRHITAVYILLHAKTSSDSPGIPRILWNPKVHYRVHRTQQPAPIVSYIKLYSLVVTWCTNRINTQQLYLLPTLCWCVLYLSENKQRSLSAPYRINVSVFVPEMKGVYIAVETGPLNKAVFHSSPPPYAWIFKTPGKKDAAPSSS